jgi:hypothetical protein
MNSETRSFVFSFERGSPNVRKNLNPPCSHRSSSAFSIAASESPSVERWTYENGNPVPVRRARSQISS